MQTDKNTIHNQVKSALFGVAVGDAVGLPFEFSSREKMQLKPATGMVGYGTYDLPPGTWSDDSSLTFCLAEALISEGISLPAMARNFSSWKNRAWWSANGEVFDIGSTTSQAIARTDHLLKEGREGELINLQCGGDASENGNGSLMRILPLLFYITGKPIREQFEIIWEVSALTHRHIRAAMACLIYLKLAEKLLTGAAKEIAYEVMRSEIATFWDDIAFTQEERAYFNRVITADIRKISIEELNTGGYVIESLESALWFFLNKDSYRDTIISIINLGHDTDTSAAIAGGLAGLFYGYESIPADWLNLLARKEDIDDLAKRLSAEIPGLYN